GGGARRERRAAHVERAVGVVDALDLPRARVQALLRDGDDEADDVLIEAGRVLDDVADGVDLEGGEGRGDLRAARAGEGEVGGQVGDGEAGLSGRDGRLAVEAHRARRDGRVDGAVEELLPGDGVGRHLQDGVAGHGHGDAVDGDGAAPEELVER